jgi:hypothetical protein
MSTLSVAHARGRGVHVRTCLGVPHAVAKCFVAKYLVSTILAARKPTIYEASWAYSNYIVYSYYILTWLGVPQAGSHGMARVPLALERVAFA